MTLTMPITKGRSRERTLSLCKMEFHRAVIAFACGESTCVGIRIQSCILYDTGRSYQLVEIAGQRRKRGVIGMHEV